MYSENTVKSIWQLKAERLGFTTYMGKKVKDMTDDEIREAIDNVSKMTNTYYIWRN